MSVAHEDVRLFAEEPDRFMPMPPAPSKRVRNERFALFLGPTPWITTISGVRVAPEGVESVVEEVRRLLAAARHLRATWMIGPSSRPVGLAERLEAVGLVPADRPPLEPTTTAMALTAPPRTGETGAIVVRKVESFADFCAVDELSFAGSAVATEERESFAATAPDRFEAYCSHAHQIRFLALIDGRKIAAAQVFVASVGLVLGGSTTVPEARGRGAYRALVRARWDEAVRRDTSALVVHAGAMSRPILESVGFEPVCELDVLLDPATS